MGFRKKNFIAIFMVVSFVKYGYKFQIKFII